VAKRKALAELDQNRGNSGLYEPKRGRESREHRAVSLATANVQLKGSLPSTDDSNLRAQLARLKEDPEALGLILCRTPNGKQTSAVIDVMEAVTSYTKSSLYRYRTQAAGNLEAMSRGSPELFREFRTVSCSWKQWSAERCPDARWVPILLSRTLMQTQKRGRPTRYGSLHELRERAVDWQQERLALVPPCFPTPSGFKV